MAIEYSVITARKPGRFAGHWLPVMRKNALQETGGGFDILGDEVEALMNVALADRRVGILLVHADIADQMGRFS